MGSGHWLAMGLALAGCGDEQISYRGDVAFTPSERAAIEQGNSWIAGQVGGAPSVIVWDLSHPSDPQAAEDFTIVRLDSASPYREHGAINRSRMVLAPAADPSRTLPLTILAAHEFGHLFGFKDHDEVGVMNHKLSRELLWTDADRRAR